MSGQFFCDEGRDHRSVYLFHNFSRGTGFVSHLTNLPYHLLDPSRRTQVIGGFLGRAVLLMRMFRKLLGAVADVVPARLFLDELMEEIGNGQRVIDAVRSHGKRLGG